MTRAVGIVLAAVLCVMGIAGAVPATQAALVYSGSYTGAELDALVTAGQASYPSGRTVALTGSRLDFTAEGGGALDIVYRLPIADAGDVVSDLDVTITADVAALTRDCDVWLGVSDGTNAIAMGYFDNNDGTVYSIPGTDYGWRITGADPTELNRGVSHVFPATFQITFGTSTADFVFSGPGGHVSAANVDVTFDQTQGIDVILVIPDAFEEHGYASLAIDATATVASDAVPEPASLGLLGW